VSRFLSTLGAVATAWCLAAPAAAQLATEALTVAKLPAPDEHRLYVSDITIQHIVDNRLHVLDGASGRYLGQFATGYAGQSALSRDRKELYVTTSYYARLARGERSDVVEIHDPTTLDLVAEIAIPPRRAQALPYEGLVRSSVDGRWLFVQNVTPATSITVVDLKARKFAAEIPNPGCWAIIPSETAADRFATICGDGTLQTMILAADGSLASSTRSERFFDADVDPVFVQSQHLGDLRGPADRHVLVSFLGKVHVADLSQPTARIGPAWSLVGAADAAQGWRPGGYQLFAVHRLQQRMYIGMHKGGAEGSHKNPAEEIWVVDLRTRERVARLPGHMAVALVVSQTPAPTLYALDAVAMAIARYDAGPAPRFVGRIEGVAESATMLELH